MTHRLRMALAVAGLTAALMERPVAAEMFLGDTTDGPTWNSPFASGIGLTGVIVPYGALAFEVSASGSYVFTATPQSEAFDIVQFLYDETFSPSAPLDGYLQGENSQINGEAEQFSFALTSNTTYIAVTTGNTEIDYDPYVLSITGPGNVTMVEPGFQPGDFNEDGSVDGGDLFSWREGFDDVGPKSHTQGDGDGDMDVDGDDFLIWQRQLNVSFGAAPVASAVPEPSALAMVLVGAVRFARRRRAVTRERRRRQGA